MKPDFITNYFIYHLKLKSRIYAGYLFAGIAALAIVIISYLTFNNTVGDFSRFVWLSSHSRADLQLTSNLREMQRQATIYTHEGHQGAADRVEEISELMMQYLAGQKQTKDPVVNAAQMRIVVHLNTYIDAFKLVRVHRQKQLQLVNVDFRNNAIRVETLMNKLLNQSRHSQSMLLDLQRAFNYLLLIEKHASRYFDSLDARNVDAAKENISKVVAGLAKIGEQHEDVSIISALAPLTVSLSQYERTFLEAVQHTRGYLYLVNVVMAAEAFEILYQGEKLVKHLEDQMTATEELILSSVGRALNVVLIIGSVLLVLIMLFSYFISQSVALPVRRLTNIFNSLSTGSSKTTIPIYDLSDELGELTLSAEAFRQKNEQTEELLQRSFELTKELELNKIELERSNDELEQFVYTVSHDLKSPLVTSMGFIGIIRKLAEQGRYLEAVEKLDKVVASNERMGQLINDLLELSRVGRIDLDMKLIQLDELMGRFVRSQKERLAEKGFKLIVQDGLPSIYANESRILQVFENILSNALKYVQNDEQGPLLEIGAAPSEDGLLIYCMDNGPGIPKEYHLKIFGLFYRLQSKTEGTGIGLAVAKKVMQFHHGEIWVESEPDKGAVFWLHFPHPPEETDR